MAELKLPDISDEDKAKIADIEAELKAYYDEELASGVADKPKKKELNERHREAVKVAHQNRMDAINANPDLKALHAELLQHAGDQAPVNVEVFNSNPELKAEVEKFLKGDK
jgi:hypothetical protein